MISGPNRFLALVGVHMKSFLKILFISLGLLGACAAEEERNALVILNVNVLPMDIDRVLENQTVVVVDGRITQVGDAHALAIPGQAKVIDGQGRYLIPGLADLHVHVRHADEYVNYLAHGVTTIMHLGGSESRGRKLLDDRRKIENGDLTGPNIYATERVFDGDPAASSGGAYRLSLPDDARKRVIALKQAGFDFIKIYNNVSYPVFQAIVDEAQKQGLPVFGHIPRDFNPLTALRQGQNAVVHSEEFFFTYFNGPRRLEGMDRTYQVDFSSIPELGNTLVKNEVAVMPDLSFTFTNLLMWDNLDIIWNDTEFKFQHPDTIADWRRSNINRRKEIENFVVRGQWKYELLQELTRQFHKAGVLQVIGTDAALAGLYPGKAAHRELTELVKAGLSNFEALSTGTRNAGEFVRRYIDKDIRFGQIMPGFRADLVLVDKNPLADIRHAREVIGVVVNGRWIERTDLDQQRSVLAERYQQLRDFNLHVDSALEHDEMKTALATLLESSKGDAEIAKAIERRINSAGYSAAGAGKAARAREILEIGTYLFPESANAWDSLAEICLTAGDREQAIAHYNKALEVNPQFSNAIQQLEKIMQDGTDDRN